MNRIIVVGFSVKISSIMLSRIALRNVGGLLKNNYVGLVSKRFCTKSNQQNRMDLQDKLVTGWALCTFGSALCGAVYYPYAKYDETRREYSYADSVIQSTLNFGIGWCFGSFVGAIFPVLSVFAVIHGFDKIINKPNPIYPYKK